MRFPFILMRFLLSVRRHVVVSTSAPPLNPAITATQPAVPFAHGTVGVQYGPFQLSYSGGTPPVSWSVVSGTTGGLQVLSNGTITGVPSFAVAASFTARVQDSLGESDTATYGFTIYDTVSVTDATLPQGQVGQNYNVTFTAAGGLPPYTFMEDNNRPAGTNLSSGGTLSGVPLQPQTIHMTVTATDAEGRTGTRAFDITIAAAASLAITTSSLKTAVVGVSYAGQFVTLAATGGSGVYTWSMTGNPSWLTINPTTGQLLGIPNAIGTPNITFTANDGQGHSGSRTLSLLIVTSDVSITTTTLGYATVGTPFSATLAASGAAGNFQWVVTSGALPAGLSLSQLTGVISGTPVMAQSTAFTIGVVDGNGATAFAPLTLISANPVVVAAQTFASQVVGTAFNPVFSASGGSGALTYTLIGSLPVPITLNPDGTTSGGNLTSVGSTTWNIVATDVQGRASPPRSFGLVVSAASSGLNIITTTLPPGIAGQPYSGTIVAEGGVLPFTWSDTSNTFNVSGTGQSCTITGNPAVPFQYNNINVSVTDSSVPPQTDTQVITLSITASAITVTTGSLPHAVEGSNYLPPAITASGGTLPYTFTLTTFPTGMTMSAGGSISWPLASVTAVGSPHAVRVHVVDALGATGDSSIYSLVVDSNALQIPAFTMPTGVVGQQFQVGLTAAGGTPPYTWSDSGSVPNWNNTFDVNTVGGNGYIVGTPDAVGTYGPFTLTVTDAALATANRSVSITVIAAGVVVDDWSYRTGARLATHVVNSCRFDSVNDVGPHMWRNNYYNAHPTSPDGQSGIAQWVNSTHPDASIRIPGYTGCMRITVPQQGPPPVGTDNGSNDNASVLWIFRLNSSWPTVTEQDWLTGYRAGDEFWVYYRLYLPQIFVDTRWPNRGNTLTTFGGGGWKTSIIDNLGRTNSAAEIVVNNQDYRDHIQGYHGGSTGPGWPISLRSDLRQQDAVDHASATTHPVGLDPNTGSTVQPGGDASEQERKRYGGMYSQGGTYVDRPLNSDQSSGAMMWRRDFGGRWSGILHHVKIGDFGSPNSIIEVWAHKANGDYLLIHDVTNANLRPSTDNFIESPIPAYPGYPGPSGTLHPALSPDGTHGFTGLNLTVYNTSRWFDANIPDRYMYYGEVIIAEGFNGIPAPGKLDPPVSQYTIPSYVPATAGAVAQLTTVTNGRATLASVIPTEYQTTQGRSIFQVWCGGYWDYHKRVMFWGGAGGHSDSNNNMTAKFDFNGATNAFGWTYIDGSPLSDVRQTDPSLTTNKLFYHQPTVDDPITNIKWGTVHNYQQECVLRDGRLLRMGGAAWSVGNELGVLFSFDPVTLVYTVYQVPASSPNFFSNADYGNALFYDEGYNKVLMFQAGSGRFAVFDPVTNTISSSVGIANGGTGGGGGGQVGYAYVQSNPRTGSLGRLVWMGSYGGAFKTFEFNGTSVSSLVGGTRVNNQAVNWTAAGTTAGAGGTLITTSYAPAMVFDPERNCIWCMDLHRGTSGARGINRIYLWRMTATMSASNTFTFDRTTLSGTAISTTDSNSGNPAWNDLPNGGYNKLGLLKYCDALVLINRIDDPLYVIRKPT